MTPKRRIGIIVSTALLGALVVSSILATISFFSAAGGLPEDASSVGYGMSALFFVIGIFCMALILDSLIRGHWFEHREHVNKDMLTTFTLNNGVFVMYENEGYWYDRRGRQTVDSLIRTTFYNIKKQPVKSKLDINWKQMPSIEMEE